MSVITIDVRATPWDARAFNIDTYEIIFPVDVPIDAAEKYSNHLNEITNPQGQAMFYCRFDAHLDINKKILTEAGFYYCETQLQIQLGRLQSYVAPPGLGSKRLSISEATESDYDEVAHIAPDVFKFSRFHEDPYLDKGLCNKRMGLWAKDMKKNGTPLLVSRNRSNKIECFLFYRFMASSKVELILGGSVPGRELLTPFFWVTFLEYFKSLGVQDVCTKISASNIGIANIYMYLGFGVKRVFLDYHKLV